MRGAALTAVILVAALAAFAAFATQGCIDQRCRSHSDCARGEICVEQTGLCEVPECVEDRQCPGDLRCFGWECVAPSGPCNCIRAKEFCGADLAPASPTAGGQVCVPSAFPDGAVLFFGSVGCPTCRSIFSGLVAVRDSLAAAGRPARLVFVQLADYTASRGDVADAFPGATTPVVQDSLEAGIWAGYAAGWYDAVVVDRNGCVAHKANLYGQSVEVIRAPWTAAMTAACSAPPDGVPDAAPDAAPDVAEAAPDAAEPVPDVAEPAPDAIEPPADVAADVPADVPSETALDSVQPLPVCQVANVPPSGVGGPVPQFSCEDVNPSSPTFGTPVTNFLLAELVWIAYFGTCT